MSFTMSNASLFTSIGVDFEVWSPSTGETVKASSVLSNKVVLLYFSAQWCGPCARFTPILKELYARLKQLDNTSNQSDNKDAPSVEDFEIVFCSLDKTHESYQAYTNQMPWWCLPFKSTVMGTWANLYADDPRNGLAIPLLVILDRNGSPLSSDGVGRVTLDPTGEQFPWRPPRIMDILRNPTTQTAFDTNATEATSSWPQQTNQYIDADGQRHALSTLDDKYLLLYFGAHWCQPCQTFVPLLNKAYDALRQERQADFELLYVSLDHDERGFDANLNKMSFGALPYEYRELKTALTTRLQIRTIPQLVILGPCPELLDSNLTETTGSVISDHENDRAVINRNLRGIFEADEYLSDFPYRPKRYGDLSKVTDNINSFRCIIVFHENGDDDEQSDIKNVLRRVAELEQDDPTLRFFWSFSPTGLAQSVREALQLGTPTTDPILVLLDIPGQGSYYQYSPSSCSSSSGTIISVETILEFMAHPGERRQL